jgi:plastocyanin
MMKKAILLAGSFLALLGVGYAFAAGMTIALTANGPQPAIATVAWGDTVTFSNADAKAHQVAIPRVAVQTPEIPPGGKFEYVFNGRQGNYGYRQMGGGPNKPGTIVVEVKGAVTLTAKPEVVPWGGTVRFAGKSSFPGLPVNLTSYPVGGGSADWSQVGTVAAGADGTFVFSVRPQAGARYRAQVAADQLRSEPVLVSVKPVVTARALARRAKTGRPVTITGRITPVKSAKMVDLERFDARGSRWVSELRQKVSATGRATFKWKTRQGKTRLRVGVLPRSLAPGWAASASTAFTVTGVGEPPRRRG